MLPDLVAPAPRVLFCVPAAGACSVERGHYHSARGDAFWQLLHASGLVPVPLGPADDALLPRHGLGLCDLDRAPGGGWEVAALRDLVRRTGPGWVALEGKGAAAAVAGRPQPLGPVPWTLEGAPVFVLPSSSGANRRRDYDGRPDRLSWWRQLAGLVGAAAAPGRG
ncbi:mismatch-specific DNA-glycosylase [Vallicoccus soli]|uniref:Uracil-DNA glycosylase-like domain-containing protein n=1 Tax=Vallicoccus soli TaxID=2339232 RepID=A0A3A3Z5C5_9ACTN|nr:mismatch-specific DNA-glycosylase [Vallicoccus soli]RJK98173.1 hypothetical protein D5H78_04495 [Vallicoccus soli]